MVPNGKSKIKCDYGKCAEYTGYDVYIQTEGKLNLNKDSSGLFRDIEKLEGFENLDFSNVTNMSYMFNGISSTINIKVANNNLRDWVIEVSDTPKLTTSNFIVG